MKIEEDKLYNLNLAFNESRILDCKILENEKEVVATFEQFALLKDGKTPDDTKVKFIFENVSRVAVLLKLGEWNDEKATVKSLTVDKFSQEVKELNGEEMYGWEFINVPKSEKEFNKWEHKASLDISLQSQSTATNTIDIFSEHFSENPKTLDLRIWFEKFRIETILGEEIDEAQFIERGQRAWNKVFNGTHILPSKTETKEQRSNKPSVMNKLKSIFK